MAPPSSPLRKIELLLMPNVKRSVYKFMQLYEFIMPDLLCVILYG